MSTKKLLGDLADIYADAGKLHEVAAQQHEYAGAIIGTPGYAEHHAQSMSASLRAYAASAACSFASATCSFVSDETEQDRNSDALALAVTRCDSDPGNSSLHEACAAQHVLVARAHADTFDHVLDAWMMG